MKFKKIISAAVGAVMLCTSLPFSSTTVDFVKENIITAHAADEIPSTGKCGENVYYSLSDDGVLTISGSGDMDNSTFSGNSSIKSVVIKNGVTSICDNAFYECVNLSSVIVSISVKSINSWAFSDCINLTSISLPDSVTSLGWGAFYGCTNLTNIIIPNSVTLISGDAFSGTKWLENKQKKNPLVVINNTLIDGKTCNGDVIIPNSVTSIVSRAFYNCTNLTGIKIPNSITSIGNTAFYNCIGLSSVILPDSVTSIGNDVFYGCTNLENITIPNSVTSIGGIAFYNTKWLENKRKENSLVIVNNILIDGVTCNENVIIPDFVTSISGSAFYSCTNLSSIAVPDSVTSIDFNTFYNCTNLKDVYYSGTEEEWKKVDIDENGNDPLLNATIHYNSSNPEETTEPTEEATTAVTTTTKSTTTTTKRATTTVKLITTTRKATTTTESLKTSTLLVLGDNISTGSGLPDTNNSYANLIADYYGATYINYAQDGLMAEDLKISLENGDYDTELSKADYVLVTIGENDIISTVIEIIKKVAIKYGYDVDDFTSLKDFLSIFSSEDQQMIDEIIEEFAMTISVRYISENYIKPCFYYISNHTNGKVVFQTVYNPFSINTSSSEWAPYKSRLDNINAKMDIYCSVMKKYYEKYANNYDNIQILDTYTNFADHGETLTNIESMDINPNQAGHLYLAADIISLLGGKKANEEKIKSSYDSLAEPYKSNLLAIDDAKTKILNLIDNTIEPPTETYDPVSISPKTIELVQGEKTKIEITGGDKNYKFVLSDDEKVVISPDGMVTALKPGIVKITVVDGVGNTDTITVTITAFTQPVTEPLTIISTEESSTTETPTSGENNLYGDINVDDNVTIADAVLLNKYLVNSATLSAQGKINADAYFDKVITSADTLAILKLIVGTYDSLPIYP